MKKRLLLLYFLLSMVGVWSAYADNGGTITVTLDGNGNFASKWAGMSHNNETTLKVITTTSEKGMGLKYTVSNYELSVADLESIANLFKLGGSNLKVLDISAAATGVSVEGLSKYEVPTYDLSVASVFANCVNLEKVILGKQEVKTGLLKPTRSSSQIPSSAFSGCTNLKVVENTADVSKIGASAFENSGLESIVLNEISEVGASAFQNSGLKSISFKLPTGATTIGTGAFKNCTNLTTCVFDPTLVATNFTIGVEAFAGCSKLTGITIPSTSTTVMQDAFNGANLNQITFTYNVTPVILNNDALRNCGSDVKVTVGTSSITGLKRSITMNNNWNHVPALLGEVSDDTTLKISSKDILSVYAGELTGSIGELFGATTVNEYITHKLALYPKAEQIDISDWLFIPANSFKDAKFTNKQGKNINVTLGNQLLFIGDNAFQNSDLKSIELPISLGTLNVVKLEDLLKGILGDGLGSLISTLIGGIDPSNTPAIGDNAFANTQLTEITLPMLCNTVGSGAFAIPTLKSVTVKGAASAYNNATGIFEGSAVESFKMDAESMIYGVALGSIKNEVESVIQALLGLSDNGILAGLIKSIDLDQLLSSFDGTKLGGSIDMYFNQGIPANAKLDLSNWAFIPGHAFKGKVLSNRMIVMPKATLSIGESAFEGATMPAGYDLPKELGIVQLGVNSAGMSTIKTILTNIGGLSGLLPGDVKNILDAILADLDGNLQINLNDIFPTIGNSAFKGARGLNGTLNFHMFVNEIGDEAFADSDVKKVVVFGCAEPGKDAFKGTALEEYKYSFTSLVYSIQLQDMLNALKNSNIKLEDTDLTVITNFLKQLGIDPKWDIAGSSVSATQIAEVLNQVLKVVGKILPDIQISVPTINDMVTAAYGAGIPEGKLNAKEWFFIPNRAFKGVDFAVTEGVGTGMPQLSPLCFSIGEEAFADVKNLGGYFKLPLFCSIVQKNAFANTDLNTIRLQGLLLYVGSNAFGSNLERVELGSQYLAFSVADFNNIKNWFAGLFGKQPANVNFTSSELDNMATGFDLTSRTLFEGDALGKATPNLELAESFVMPNLDLSFNYKFSFVCNKNVYIKLGAFTANKGSKNLVNLIYKVFPNATVDVTHWCTIPDKTFKDIEQVKYVGVKPEKDYVKPGYVYVNPCGVKIGVSAFDGCKNITNLDDLPLFASMNDNTFANIGLKQIKIGAWDKYTNKTFAGNKDLTTVIFDETVEVPNMVLFENTQKLVLKEIEALQRVIQMKKDEVEKDWGKVEKLPIVGTILKKFKEDLSKEYDRTNSLLVSWKEQVENNWWALNGNTNTITKQAFSNISTLTTADLSLWKNVPEKALSEIGTLQTVSKMPANDYKIGASAFSACGKLSKFDTNNELTKCVTIDQNAFAGTALPNITLYASTLGSNLFKGSKITNVNVKAAANADVNTWADAADLKTIVTEATITFASHPKLASAARFIATKPGANVVNTNFISLAGNTGFKYYGVNLENTRVYLPAGDLGQTQFDNVKYAVAKSAAKALTSTISTVHTNWQLHKAASVTVEGIEAIGYEGAMNTVTGRQTFYFPIGEEVTIKVPADVKTVLINGVSKEVRPDHTFTLLIDGDDISIEIGTRDEEEEVPSDVIDDAVKSTRVTSFENAIVIESVTTLKEIRVISISGKVTNITSPNTTTVRIAVPGSGVYVVTMKDENDKTEVAKIYVK